MANTDNTPQPDEEDPSAHLNFHPAGMLDVPTKGPNRFEFKPLTRDTTRRGPTMDSPVTDAALYRHPSLAQTILSVCSPTWRLKRDLDVHMRPPRHRFEHIYGRNPMSWEPKITLQALSSIVDAAYRVMPKWRGPEQCAPDVWEYLLLDGSSLVIVQGHHDREEDAGDADGQYTMHCYATPINTDRLIELR